MKATVINPLIFTLFLAFFSGNVVAQVETPNSADLKNAHTVIDFMPSGLRPQEEQTKKIETAYFNVEIDSKGGSVRSFRHKDSENALKNNVDFVTEDPFYFNIYRTPESSTLLRNSQYRLQTTENANEITIRATLDVKAKTQDGIYPVTIVKTYKFDKTLHYWNFSWSIENNSTQKLSIPELYFIPMNDIGPVSKSDSSNNTKNLKNFYQIDGNFKSMLLETAVGESGGILGFFKKSANIGDIETVKGNLDYFGMGSRFMIMTVQPLTKSGAVTLVINNHKKKEMHAHLAPQIIEAHQKGKYEFILYTGPKVNKFFNLTPEMLHRMDSLKLLNKETYKAFDFGVTAPIRDFIVVILKLLYKIIPNYGVAIILLVIALRAIFFPLNQAQAKSMKKMQELQPKIKEINEKYKNNPQEKQRKTIELYKIHKANPMGGCLPMIIQIPVLIALISAFTDSYELWGSPFIKGWINDLSEPDTVYTVAQSIPVIGGFHLNILPIIMAVSQIFQAKFTMVSVDKNQKLMAQILPVVMTVMFWSFPSGAVIYWILFNFLSVLQQVLTNRNKQDALPVKKA